MWWRSPPSKLTTAQVGAKLRETLGFNVIFDEYIGHTYMAVPEEHRARIPDVLNALLRMLEVRKLEVVPHRPRLRAG